MLQAEQLSKSYSGELLFEKVSFSLQRGEKCALVGRNGSGKTTLFRILKGEESPDSGTVSYPKGYKMGFLDQHTKFSARTAWEEALRDLPHHKPEHEVESILYGLGFDDELLSKPPDLLSGGYHLRLKLAKVLAQEPNCLLLDEPTNYLDILSLRWLERYLKNWKGECLLISHDRDFLNNLIGYTMGIHRKSLKRVAGSLENFYEKIVEEEEIHEKTRISIEKKKGHLEDYIRRFGAKASKATQAQSKAKALDKLPSLTKLSTLYNLSFHFEYTPFYGKKLITLDHVSYAYDKSIPLIQNVSLEIGQGQRVAIIGKNGMGKSTLLKLIEGALPPQTGSYTRSDAVSMGTFGQTHILHLDESKTIEEEISDANTNLPYGAVRAICGQMMFSQDSAKKKISFLSGGEKSRVLLGKILATKTNCLLLDEPTHHLDLESIEGLMQAVDSYEGSVVIVTHSEWLLERLNPDLLVVFEEGKQRVFEGNYIEFLEKEGWKEPVSSKKEKKTTNWKKKPDKPLEREIAKLEKAIETAESDILTAESDLAKAYEENLSSNISELTNKVAKLEKEIEELYTTLSEKYQESE
jgi:ATP-binding cassette, subfamily F, member 3